MRYISYSTALIPCDLHNEPMTLEQTLDLRWQARSLFEACACAGPICDTQEEAALAWGVKEEYL